MIDPEAVWRRHAEDRALSFKSVACVRGSTVSCGLNLSRTDWNWTLLRAKKERSLVNDASILHISPHNRPGRT